jgi:hypothetical protein
MEAEIFVIIHRPEHRPNDCDQDQCNDKAVHKPASSTRIVYAGQHCNMIAPRHYN